MWLKHCEVESRVEFFNGDIQEIIKSKKTIKKWAYILHDKDDTAPHYHIYLNFGDSSVDTKEVASWFGLQESQVNRIRGRATDMLEYLTHANNSQQNKYQYSPDEVVANFDFLTAIKNSKILGDFEKYSYAQQLHYVNSLPVSEKTQAYAKLDKLWRLHCQCLVLNPDRDIEVMFIHGKGGTGKTYYAKKLLDKMGYDYCVSSSSNDPFQDYMGQQAIILDDLRDKAFEFEDLLKLLDNNTASSVRSRFSNKVFNGKMIVITSTVPLAFWYRTYQYDDKDTLQQLYRRITSYVVVTTEHVSVYDELDARGRPSGIPYVYKNEIPDLKRQSPRRRTKFADIFDEMLEDASPDIIDEFGRTLNVMNGREKAPTSEQLKINKNGGAPSDP